MIRLELGILKKDVTEVRGPSHCCFEIHDINMTCDCLEADLDCLVMLLYKMEFHVRFS